jgi:hypothetical protein
MRRHPSWDSPAEIVAATAEQYREDLWRDQDFRLEVWIEKDALLGVIERVCDEFRVPYFACRGNNSESEQYKAGKRFEEQLESGLTPIVLHLGDHDPNGLDMTRDNRDRLAMFARRGVEVRRLALNMDQIDRYRPPPNFAKESDTRYGAYAEKFGAECWKLDALDPAVIAELIRREVEGMIDADVWNAAKDEEAANRALLEATLGNWASVETSSGTTDKRPSRNSSGTRWRDRRWPGCRARSRPQLQGPEHERPPFARRARRFLGVLACRRRLEGMPRLRSRAPGT